MPITNIIKMYRKTKKLILVLIFSICITGFLYGYSQKSENDRLQHYLEQSQFYYQRALKLYKDLISRTKDASQLRLGLGRLYYSHGEFQEAINTLKNLDSPQAKKFLAISYYRLGNFTDALEVFSRNDLSDDEYLYYYGRTCEKMNLYERSKDIYKKISSLKFVPLARQRLNAIEKQTKQLSISYLDPDISNIIAASPPQGQYPQAGAFILLADEKIMITQKDTQVSQMHYLIKILNERGKENFSETHIDYDSTYEKVELGYARTIKPDGTVTEVGTKYIRDVSKYLNFPLYSNARVFIISFPEVTEGAVIEYKLKIYRNELINKKDFVLSYPVQDTEPIITAKFVLDVPQERTVNIKILNERYNNFGAVVKPTQENKGGRLIYSWHFKNIPQIIPESNMPPPAEINPTIFISSFSSWEQIYDWWWALAKDKIKPTAEIKQKVRQLTANQPSSEAKARAIYNFCAKEIRYVAVEYGQAGYEPHQAEDIFKNKYGDCKDQAILLVTMLKEAGFSSWPVLISTKSYYNLNPDFPSLLFNHCIAAVSLKGKTLFLDPTAETCSFGDLPGPDQKRQVLVFKENSYDIKNTPLYPAGHNLIKQTLRIKINSDEQIQAQKNIFTQGLYEQFQRYWLLYTPPELIRDKLNEAIQQVSIGARLENYKIENLDNLNKSVVLEYRFYGPEYFTSAGKLRILPQLSDLDTSVVAKDKRRYPLDFGILDAKESAVKIEIPPHFGIRYIPESITEENPWLSFSAEYIRKNNTIQFHQKTELKSDTISQQEYPEFKKALEGLAKKVKQRIVLERIK
jgi:transglutaminase-like putative cysteine protease